MSRIAFTGLLALALALGTHAGALAVSYDFDHTLGWEATAGRLAAQEGRLVLTPQGGRASAAIGTFVDLDAAPYLCVKCDGGTYTLRVTDPRAQPRKTYPLAENAAEGVLAVNLPEKTGLAGRRHLLLTVETAAGARLDYVRFARSPEENARTAVPPTSVPPLSEYTCQRAAGPIRIDGVLDEPSWQKARSTADFPIYHGQLAAAHPTSARLLWDDERLYLAVTCTDPDVRATRTEHDDDIFAEDCVEFFIMEQRFRERYSHFLEYEVNALGTRFDSYNFAPYQGLVAWDSRGWECAVKVDGTLNDASDRDRGWTLEMSIPFIDLHGLAFRTEARAKEYLARRSRRLAPRPGDSWRANIYRIKHTDTYTEHQTWSPTIVDGFHAPARFGILHFSARQAGEEEPPRKD